MFATVLIVSGIATIVILVLVIGGARNDPR